MPATSVAVDGREDWQFARWLAADRAGEVASYEAFLRAGVLGIVPMHQLLRTASDWNTPACQQVDAPPFEIPPRALWPQAIPTLKLVALLRERRVLPEFEVVSAYRNPRIEACADGSGKRHPTNGALDIVPCTRAMWKPQSSVCVVSGARRERTTGWGFRCIRRGACPSTPRGSAAGARTASTALRRAGSLAAERPCGHPMLPGTAGMLFASPRVFGA